MSFYYCVIMTVFELQLNVCNDSGKHKFPSLSSLSVYVLFDSMTFNVNQKSISSIHCT